MAALNTCNCVLKIKDQLGDAFLSAELVLESRKTQMHTADAVYISRPARSTTAPGIVIQDLLYISKSQLPETPITVTYIGGGTAGAEVVTVTDTDISVQIESGVSTAAQIRTAIITSGPAFALVYSILSGTAGSAQVTVSTTTLDEAYCYLPAAETTTDLQQVIFTLNYYDEGHYYGSIIFDPVQIPDQSYVDLSTILTVSRG